MAPTAMAGGPWGSWPRPSTSDRPWERTAASTTSTLAPLSAAAVAICSVDVVPPSPGALDVTTTTPLSTAVLRPDAANWYDHSGGLPTSFSTATSDSPSISTSASTG